MIETIQNLPRGGGCMPIFCYKRTRLEEDSKLRESTSLPSVADARLFQKTQLLLDIPVYHLANYKLTERKYFGAACY